MVRQSLNDFLEFERFEVMAEGRQLSLELVAIVIKKSV